jgi:hypothetical protein
VKKHPDAGVKLLEGLGEGTAVHVRHHHVRHEEVDSALVFAGEGESVDVLPSPTALVTSRKPPLWVTIP